jgi:hypothetical protein
LRSEDKGKKDRLNGKIACLARGLRNQKSLVEHGRTKIQRAFKKLLTCDTRPQDRKNII